VSEESRYVPAAGIDALTGVYDVGVRLTMREGRWRRLMVDEIATVDPQVVLDVGCGTGTLTIAAAEELHQARVVGLDGDRKVLDLAGRKAGSEHVEWIEGLADQLPFADGEVDGVMTSLVFHHLPLGIKRAALAEMRRVLRPGGRLVVADWGRPQDLVMSAAFVVLQCLDGFANTNDNRRGLVPQLVGETGFVRLRVLRRLRTVGGTFEVMAATAPEVEPAGPPGHGNLGA
jgi:ubiquinone/menaquinone biosynthesis C-methylase UbiE